MELTKQVVSLELAKRLKELGVKQWSLFWYVNLGKNEWHERWGGEIFGLPGVEGLERISAFTSSELGEMLPLENQGLDLTKINEDDDKGWRWEVARHINHDADFGGFEKTEADARAKMLIYLIENSLIPLPIK